MATWEECNKKIDKIVPPPSESAKDAILNALGYEEREVTIGGETMTILVKSDESE